MNDFKLKRILVPTDTSDSSRLALDYARLFADRFGAESVLFYADPILCPITFIDVAADGAPLPGMSSWMPAKGCKGRCISRRRRLGASRCRHLLQMPWAD